MIFHSTKYILVKHCSRDFITPFASGHAISLTNKAHDFMREKIRENIKSMIKQKLFRKSLLEFLQENLL